MTTMRTSRQISSVPARSAINRAVAFIGSCIIGALAIVVLGLLLGCALATEAYGRLRHGKNYEPGDGIGSSEDYA